MTVLTRFSACAFTFALLLSAHEVSATPAWIIYDDGFHQNTAYIGVDPNERYAVRFIPPSAPTQVMKVRIFNADSVGAPVRDFNFRIANDTLTTEHFQMTNVTPTALGVWTELNLATEDIVVQGSFYVQWWPVLGLTGPGLGFDTSVGGTTGHSFYCASPDVCSSGQDWDYMIRVQVDDCDVFQNPIFGCEPLGPDDDDGNFLIPIIFQDRTGPIADCALDQPLCEVTVIKTQNIVDDSIVANLKASTIAGRLADPTLPGGLSIEALTSTGPLPYEYTIQAVQAVPMLGVPGVLALLAGALWSLVRQRRGRAATTPGDPLARPE